jgi:hypothetical protein
VLPPKLKLVLVHAAIEEGTDVTNLGISEKADFELWPSEWCEFDRLRGLWL